MLGKAIEKATHHDVQLKMLDLYALFLSKKAKERNYKKKDQHISLFIIKLHKPKVQTQNQKRSKLDCCKSYAANDNRTNVIGLFSPNMPI